jgi:hypothetical protein
MSQERMKCRPWSYRAFVIIPEQVKQYSRKTENQYSKQAKEEELSFGVAMVLYRGGFVAFVIGVGMSDNGPVRQQMRVGIQSPVNNLI